MQNFVSCVDIFQVVVMNTAKSAGFLSQRTCQVCGLNLPREETHQDSECDFCFGNKISIFFSEKIICFRIQFAHTVILIVHGLPS